MNASKLTARLNHQVSAMSNRGAKIVGGIALTGLMMAAVALPSAQIQANEPARPLVQSRAAVTDSFWDSFYEQMAEVEGTYSAANSSSREVAADSDPFWESFHEGMLEIERDGAPRLRPIEEILDADQFWGPFYERMTEVEGGGMNGLAAVEDAFWGSFYERMSGIEGPSGSVHDSPMAGGTDSEEFWAAYYERMAGLERPRGLEGNSILAADYSIESAYGGGFTFGGRPNAM